MAVAPLGLVAGVVVVLLPNANVPSPPPVLGARALPPAAALLAAAAAGNALVLPATPKVKLAAVAGAVAGAAVLAAAGWLLPKAKPAACGAPAGLSDCGCVAVPGMKGLDAPKMVGAGAAWAALLAPPLAAAVAPENTLGLATAVVAGADEKLNTVG